MKFGYLRQDESSHWYLVPEELIGEYDALIEEMGDSWEDDDDLCIDYIDKYGEYMLGGAIQHLKVVMEE